MEKMNNFEWYWWIIIAAFVLACVLAIRKLLKKMSWFFGG